MRFVPCSASSTPRVSTSATTARHFRSASRYASPIGCRLLWSCWLHSQSSNQPPRPVTATHSARIGRATAQTRCHARCEALRLPPASRREGPPAKNAETCCITSPAGLLSPYRVRDAYDVGRHMHYQIARLSSKGQFVIPENVRKMLGLRAGSKLALFTDGEHILLKPIPTPDVSAFRKMAKEATKVAEEAKAKRKEAKP
ncbi:AbrB/MazE/SpoVT family DNA-binding domain-containing protein [Kiritimatiella glycovorans]